VSADGLDGALGCDGATALPAGGNAIGVALCTGCVPLTGGGTVGVTPVGAGAYVGVVAGAQAPARKTSTRA